MYSDDEESKLSQDEETIEGAIEKAQTDKGPGSDEEDAIIDYRPDGEAPHGTPPPVEPVSTSYYSGPKSTHMPGREPRLPPASAAPVAEHTEHDKQAPAAEATSKESESKDDEVDWSEESEDSDKKETTDSGEMPRKGPKKD